MILFYGGLNLSLPVLRRVWVALGLLIVPGVVVTAVMTGIGAHAVSDLPWTAALLRTRETGSCRRRWSV